MCLPEVDINERLKHVTLNLCVSKTDPAGRGARRTLGCVCPRGGEDKNIAQRKTDFHETSVWRSHPTPKDNGFPQVSSPGSMLVCRRAMHGSGWVLEGLAVSCQENWC